jgi:hypothetical protein
VGLTLSPLHSASARYYADAASDDDTVSAAADAPQDEDGAGQPFLTQFSFHIMCALVFCELATFCYCCCPKVRLYSKQHTFASGPVLSLLLCMALCGFARRFHL